MGARNIKRLFTEALTTGEKIDLASGDSLAILPVVTDQGKFQFGDGTNDLDVDIYLGSSTEHVLFDVGNSKVTVTVPIESNTSINAASVGLTGALTPSGSGYVGMKQTTTAADALTLNATHYGGMLTVSSANAVALTLPTPAAGNSGAWVHVVRTGNENTTINCATANKILTLNAAAINTLTAATANEKIGAAMLVISNGTKWHGIALQGTWASS